MPPKLDLAPTVGALLIGVFFSICLFGTMTLQTWYYYQHYPKDNLKLKVLVAVVWCFELFHVILACHAIYFYLILNYANPVALDISDWSLALTLLATAIITLLVHSFFAWRVWIVGGSWVMPSIIIFGALVNTGFTLATTAISLRAVEFSNYPHYIKITSSIALAFAVATDITIAGSLGYYLNRGRSGYARTDFLINKLIFWAVNVGLITSSFDLVVLVTSEVGQGLIFLAVFQVVANFYANSMLATLNLRTYGRGQVLNEDGTTMEMASTTTQTAISSGGSQNIIVFQKKGTVSETRGRRSFSP